MGVRQAILNTAVKILATPEPKSAAISFGPDDIEVMPKDGAAPDTKADRSLDAQTTGLAAFGGGSGHFTDYKTYLEAYKKVFWVRACVSVIAYNCANVEMRLYKRATNDNDQDEEITASPFLDLMNNPNPDLTRFDLLEKAFTDLELTGNAYWSMEEQNALGQPLELYRLRPDRVKPVPDRKSLVAGYVYTVNSKPINYTAAEVFHATYPNPLDDVYGMGTIEAGEYRFNSQISMGEHEQRFWESGAKVTGILTTDATVSDKVWTRLTQTLSAFFKGKGYSTLVLENGLKYQSVSDSPAKLGLIELAKMGRDEILAMFGVPPTKLGILENANYKAQASDEFFWTETVDPKLTRMEQKLQRLVDIFHPGEGMYAKFDRVNFQDDLPQVTVAKARQDTHTATINEIRDYLGDEPIENGDFIMIPSGMVGYDPDTGEIIDLSPEAPAIPPPAPIMIHTGNGPIPPTPPAPGNGPPAPPEVPPGPTAPGEEGVPTEVPEAPAKRRRIVRGNQKRRVSTRRPAASAIITKHRDQMLRRAEKTHAPAIAKGFRTQEATIKSRVMRHKNRKAGLTTDGVWPKDDQELQDALKAIAAAHADGMTTAYGTVNTLGVSVEYDLSNPALEDFAGNLGKRITAINETTRSAVDDQINEGLRRGYSVDQIANGYTDESYKGIAGVFDDAAGYRATMIARTETMTAYNGASVVAYKDSGVVEQMELLDGTDDEECAARNGLIVSLDEVQDYLDDEHPNGTLVAIPFIE
jgi:HK97 family phage portal protein